jgi:hypothetical protein
MQFIDCCSAFNTIVPSKLITLGKWVLDFLTGQPQLLKVDNNTSATLILKTGAPRRCVLSPLLHSLFTDDRVVPHFYNSIIKFADDTIVVDLITNNDKTGRRRRRG